MLRPFTEEEYHAFYRGYVSDGMLRQGPYTYDREQVSRSYRYEYGGFRPDTVNYGILEDGRPVGAFQLKRINHERHSCEFGILLQNVEVKNRGIGTEALRIGLKMARDEYRIRTIRGDTMSVNLAMIALFRKCGFHLLEVVSSCYTLPDGQIADCLIFEKTYDQTEWRE